MAQRGPAERRRAVVSGTLGSSVEWYDFYLYGVAAAVIFNKQFFPSGTSPYVATLLAFSTYAVGFVARPLGGIIFGHFGDRLGRKRALIVSLLMMGTATFLVGCMPTYATIGAAAPVILTVLRFIQGIGVGGEWAGATLMVTEQVPPERRGFVGGLPQVGVAFGALSSNGLYSIVSTVMGHDAFNSWGWRLPFLFSAVLVATGLYVRLSLMESPVFLEMRGQGKIERLPVLTAVREHPLTILRVAGIRIADIGNYYVWTSFMLSYAVSIGLSQNHILVPTLVVSGLSLLTIPLWGYVSDRIGRRGTIWLGALAMAVIAFPFLWAVQHGNLAVILVTLMVGVNIGRDACYGPQAAYFTELFPAHIRYSGASLGPQLASIFGGCAPLIATALAGPDNTRVGLVAGLVVVMSVVTAVSSAVSRETAIAKTGFDSTLSPVPATAGAPSAASAPPGPHSLRKGDPR
ncbi:MFS transporter [Streptomyces sp. DW26H14]|uniref:MFS transporter n=1 Tax=Streptomyces sp. DW26H14 TaxID=3435395 RepID=UPI00403D5C8D